MGQTYPRKQIQQLSKARGLGRGQLNTSLLQAEQPCQLCIQHQDGRVNATGWQAELSSNMVRIATIPGTLYVLSIDISHSLPPA